MSESKRVLLVDDDREIVESMRMVLEMKGYEVFIARNGNQGLQVIEQEHPDLVVLDMMMPGRSGFLVLESLVRNGTNQNRAGDPIRFIMITANEGKRHEELARLLGVEIYLRKPFSPEQLVDSVDQLLSSEYGQLGRGE